MQRFENKYDLLNAAYKDVDLKKGTISLLQYLVHKSNKEQCFPAVETIAAALNVCKRTVQYNMRKLEKAGYIIRKDRWYNHQQLSNQYVFNFGITEDIAGTCKYSDAEKEKIYDVLSNIPDHQEKRKDEMCQEKENPEKINKAAELLKIYNMPLSGREKLLLVYLFHRANKKGMVYDTLAVFMNAIGVGTRTLMKLLKKLRSKNLIRIRYAEISGKNMLLIKLTGNVWKEIEKPSNQDAEDNKKSDCQQISQKIVADQNQELKNNMQNTQRMSALLDDKTIRKQFRKTSFLNNIWKKWKGTIQSGLEKIRVILRL